MAGDEKAIAPGRRAQEANARAAELAERLTRLAANEPPSAEDARRAREAAERAAQRGVAAHERTAAAHRRAAKAHRQAAGVAEAAGDLARAAQHRAAAVVDDVAGRAEDAAAEADYRRLLGPVGPVGPERPDERPRPAPVVHGGHGRRDDRSAQEAHLPATVPVLPRLDIAAAYRSGTDAEISGGDWFDVVLRADGTTALIVGDVIGSGSAASATMGQLRAVCHERLASGETLDRTLADLDRFARSVPEARFATLCVVLIDPRTGKGSYCTAGHPPPLLLSRGQATFLPPTGAGPMATSGSFPLGSLDLGGDAIVMLYTDGILTPAGSTAIARTVELAQTVRDTAAGALDRHSRPVEAERVCEMTLRRMTGPDRRSDDIALVVARRRRPVGPLHLTLPARAPQVRVARDRLVVWLDAMSVVDGPRLAVVHAASELLSNVVEHAYAGADTPGDMTLDARLSPVGELTVQVSDHGRWRAPEDPGRAGSDGGVSRGRGLLLARNLLDRLDIGGSAEGTTATGRLRLERPVALIGAPAHEVDDEPGDPAGDARFELLEDRGRLVVRGAVLLDVADELGRRVRLLTRGGTLPLTVDLGGVTHLGSAGVGVLHELVTGDGAEVALVAPLGSVAQHVLELVRLPYRTG